MPHELLTASRGFVDGKWIDADHGESIAVTDPATGATLAVIPKMGAAEANRAIDAAATALSDPLSIERRERILFAIGEALSSHREALAEQITRENGKPLAEARAEVDYAEGFFRHAGQHVKVTRSVELDERPGDHAWTIHHRPAGVAALITPWNFPLAMLAKKVSAAIAADCPFVVKPAESTPLSAMALVKICDEAGLPRPRASLLAGDADAIGKVFCTHPEVRVVSFTGSTRVGKILASQSAEHFKRLALELGGNAPFVVFADADLDRAVGHLIPNKFRCAGQTCVCTNRVYVEASVADAFAEKLATEVRKLKVGNGLEEGVQLGPLINRGGFDKVLAHVNDAVGKGAVRVLGEDPVDPPGDHGCFFPPMILRGVDESMACAREETFGPILPILEFESEEEVVRRANGTEYGLAAYVFTGDPDRGERVLRRLRFGHIGWNTGRGPTPEAPFGGMKSSGYGREGGIEGILEFCESQTVPREG